MSRRLRVRARTDRARAYVRRASTREGVLRALHSTAPPRTTWSTFLTRIRSRPVVDLDLTLIGASVFVALVSNGTLWRTVDRAGYFEGSGGGIMTVGVFVLVTGVHLVPLAVLVYRHIAKIVLTSLLISAAALNYASQHGGVDLTSVEMRDLLHSARVLTAPEWRTGEFARILAWQAVAPALLLWWVRFRVRRRAVAAANRTVLILGTCAVVAIVVSFPSAGMRQLKRDAVELRYLLIPANLLALGGGSGAGLAAPARPNVAPASTEPPVKTDPAPSSDRPPTEPL